MDKQFFEKTKQGLLVSKLKLDKNPFFLKSSAESGSVKNKSAIKNVKLVRKNVRRSERTSANKEETKEAEKKPKTVVYVCVCGKEFSAKQKVNDHIRNIHGGDRYICTICADSNYNSEFWFTSKGSLKRHCDRKKHELPPETNQMKGLAFINSDD